MIVSILNDFEFYPFSSQIKTLYIEIVKAIWFFRKKVTARLPRSLPLLSLFFQRFLQPPYRALSLARYHFLFPLVPSIAAQIASVAAVVRFRSPRRHHTPVGHSSLSSSSG
ncbi:unnamed protein product [Citrullus colocynthis]|uniref:Uncharacterized protein n=1 Tax=Citrullus colocynthis TaxID=252529 RepID=A0ABP0XPK8_9ROSI